MRIRPPQHWDTALPAHYGTLADEYLVATRNPGATKRIFAAHEAHYDPAITRLVAEAPLRLADELPRVPLPMPRTALSLSLDEALARRASGHQFGPDPLAAWQLGALLYAGNGVRFVIRQGDRPVAYQRNAANAGNLGSVEIFPVVLNVAAIAPGIYHFDSVRHELVCLHAGRFRAWLRECVLHQLEFGDAAAALILTSALGRLQQKYGPRGLRYGCFDAGHVSENIYLAGAALGLAVCATAGFVEAALDTALDLDGVDVAAMLVLLVGPAEPAAN
ncbi:MAG: SagB/ThcOx family dehydrogenase [Thermomicrobiales bacterium]